MMFCGNLGLERSFHFYLIRSIAPRLFVVKNKCQMRVSQETIVSWKEELVFIGSFEDYKGIAIAVIPNRKLWFFIIGLKQKYW